MTDRIPWIVGGAVIATAILAIWAAEADAQPIPCAPTPQMMERLEKAYHEVEVGGGIVDPQNVVVVTASPGGATWTILRVTPDGMACMLAAGDDWFGGEAPKAGEGI